MHLDELRALVAIAESGSLLAAARSLKVSRGAVRRRLDALEERLGVALFVRQPPDCTLTEAAQVLLERAPGFLRDARSLLDAARAVGNARPVEVRAALPPGMPPELLVALYGHARAHLPDVLLSVRVTEDPMAQLRDGADVAVMLQDPPEAGPWRTARVIPVPVVLLAHADYVARHGVPDTLEALRQHDLLVWRQPDTDPGALPLLSGGAFPVVPRLVTSDIHMLRRAMVSGHGIAFVPDGGVPSSDEPAGAVVRVLRDQVGRPCHLRLVVPMDAAKSPALRTLIDALVPRMRDTVRALDAG